jgi:hypothetical protein
MSKKKSVALIEKAIKEAKDDGIMIIRRPMFDWSGPDKFEKPVSCDATGAVLLSLGYGYERPKDWPVMIQKHLGVGVFWLWRWWQGWGYGNKMKLVSGDNPNSAKMEDDPISVMADKLAKRHAYK